MRHSSLALGLILMGCSDPHGDGSSGSNDSMEGSSTGDEVGFAFADTETPTDATPGPGEDGQLLQDLFDGADDDDAFVDVSKPTDITVGEDGSVPDSSMQADTSPPDTSSSDTGNPGCITLASGHARHVVLSRPYGVDGQKADRWDVFPLTEEGSLGGLTETFTMGRASEGVVAFRADGALGVIAQESGTIGVFALDAAGQPQVLKTALAPGAYVESVTFGDDDTALYLVDVNWVNNGGGIYRADIACDGAVGPAVLLYPTKLAHFFVQDGDSHLIAGRAAVSEEEGHLHRVTGSAGNYVHAAGINVFGDTDEIVSSFAITGDRLFALVGDNAAFSGLPNRIGVVGLGPGNALTKSHVLTPVDDPVEILVSPFDNAVLVVSGFADDVRVLSYDPVAQPPFVDVGTPTYEGASPQLPGSSVLVGGAHPAIALVTENQAVRRFRFEANGTVTDLGKAAEGDGLEAIPGAIGVQP